MYVNRAVLRDGMDKRVLTLVFWHALALLIDNSDGWSPNLPPVQVG